MITIAHVLVGGAVGVATGNPVAALVAGTVSHFAMDLVPHLDHPPSSPRDKEGNLIFTKAIYAQAIADVLIAAAIVVFIWYNWFGFPQITPFVLGAFGGFLPDLIDNVPFWNLPFRRSIIGKPFHTFHEGIHEVWIKYFPMERFWIFGIMTQLIAAGIAIVALKYFA